VSLVLVVWGNWGQASELPVGFFLEFGSWRAVLQPLLTVLPQTFDRGPDLALAAREELAVMFASLMRRDFWGWRFFLLL